MCPVCAHRIRAGHSAQCDGVLVGTLITHDPDGADGKEDCTSLPYIVIQPPLAHHRHIDVVSILEDLDLLSRDLAEDTDT